MILAELFGADGIIVIVCVVVVLLFGGAKLPKLARGLGSASHEFKKGLEEGDKDGALPGTGTSNTSITPTTPEALPKDASAS
ncbi:MAG: twin-arginine translocase TatA/TatE family subunit [Acidimicrobiales bacterium]